MRHANRPQHSGFSRWATAVVLATRISVWARSRSNVRERTLPSGLMLFLALAAEYRHAAAATRRFEELRRLASSRNHSDIPRRIFTEFYSDPPAYPCSAATRRLQYSGVLGGAAAPA
jgi:hypothetical protein